jgi:hypothetical protein
VAQERVIVLAVRRAELRGSSFRPASRTSRRRAKLCDAQPPLSVQSPVPVSQLPQQFPQGPPAGVQQIFPLPPDGVWQTPPAQHSLSSLQ